MYTVYVCCGVCCVHETGLELLGAATDTWPQGVSLASGADIRGPLETQIPKLQKYSSIFRNPERAHDILQYMCLEKAY